MAQMPRCPSTVLLWSLRRLRSVLRGSALRSAALALLLLCAAGPGHGASWGRIANREHRGEWPISALYFAGPPNPRSLPLYTRHPMSESQVGGSSHAGIDGALLQMADAGLNTIKLSYWGHEGETDAWSPSLLFSRQRWPGDRGKRVTYTEAEQVRLARRFFRRAARHRLLVAPLLEVSPRFPFWRQFPADLSGLLGRAGWLLRSLGKEPNWLRLIDQDGKPRHVLWLIETIHVGPVDPERFAAAFDEAAESLRKSTGILPGFVLDPTPLPAYGSHAGPMPEALRKHASVLAINPFNITSQGPSDRVDESRVTEGDRLAYAESILKPWSGSPIPLMAPILPGYDARLAFPRSGVYGFTRAWRAQQAELALRYATGGLSIDCWNGWTEGYAIPPSREEGDANLVWVRDTITRLKARLGRRPAPAAAPTGSDAARAEGPRTDAAPREEQERQRRPAAALEDPRPPARTGHARQQACSSGSSIAAARMTPATATRSETRGDHGMEALFTAGGLAGLLLLVLCAALSPPAGSAAPTDGPKRPHIVGDWWQVAGDPDLGTLTDPEQQPVDFAVWQAADGKWQLWSCIRGTREMGRTRLLYRWEGERLTDANWKPMGIALRADPSFGEVPGGLQAPFVFRDGARFVMFYGGWDGICSAESADGKTFRRRLDADGKALLFGAPEGYGNPRDPMVLRAGGLWYCYYTAHTDQKGADFCRTSENLRAWGEARTVAAGGRSGSGSFSAECPFVVEPEPGCFYLFRTQRYGHDAQTSVYFSRDPLDFGVDHDEGHFLCTLPVAAPEIIRFEGRYYIASLLPSLKGIRIARLEWSPASPTGRSGG